ncbi:MAG: hypothetical protein JW830_13770 [Bacteroidales bacterium]|nr:hypothetical protein [Bacteroidales bacterium]
MKKKSEILCSIGILVLFVFCCEKETDFSECELLTGNAKLKRVLVYDSIGSTVPSKVLEQYEYDEFGRISRFSFPMAVDTNIDNRVYYYITYKYNSINQLIEKVRYHANIYSPTGFVILAKYFYTYSHEGKLIKEYIEYPEISSFSYSIYYYFMDKLIMVQNYEMGTDELESYTRYDYDKCGRLTKESEVHMVNTLQIFFTEHKYQNGHNYRSDAYVREDDSDNTHLREMLKTYDDDNNLIINEIIELDEYSAQPSRVLKYEYYPE